MTKSELRKLYLEKRRELGPAEIAERSRQIADRFFSGIDLSGLRSIHCFISMSGLGEVDTFAIFESIWRESPETVTYAPRINAATGEIEALSYSPQTLLETNRWGIREPAGAEKADPGEIDLVFVPLLCFDRRGHRVGYGKGYYDRFLSVCRPDCRKVGLSLFPPVDLIEDVHSGDVALDETVTPDESWVFSNA
jgi:5-formyltetrahydrofolate cyclo-ligase